jgi:hypothetical protein
MSFYLKIQRIYRFICKMHGYTFIHFYLTLYYYLLFRIFKMVKNKIKKGEFQSIEKIISIHEIMKLLNNYYSVLVIFIWSFAGLSTSYILKYLSTISKAYATSLEMIFVTIFSFLFLGFVYF